MSGVAAGAFWLSVGMLLYAYVGFPLLVMTIGQLRKRPIRKGSATPSMSLIIAAYNEEACIGERLDRELAADYPREALEIIVASDGSSDTTESIVARYESQGVRLLRLPRRGKIPSLTEAVRHAAGEILVFSDADILCHPQALRALARSFADPQIGGVVGHLVCRPRMESDSSGRGESLYRRYDTWLKELESRAGNVVSAPGGLYAIRREFFRPPPDAAVTDDFIISTAVIEQGHRLVFEPDARAYEVAVPETAREFRRRVRLMTRGFRAVALRRQLLNPLRYGLYSVVLFSHKVLRRLLHLPLLVLFASSLYLSPQNGFFLAAAVGQVLFYGLAAIGFLARRAPVGQWRCLYLPFFYCMANAAALVALLNFVRGERITLWQPQRHMAGG